MQPWLPMFSPMANMPLAAPVDNMPMLTPQPTIFTDMLSDSCSMSDNSDSFPMSDSSDDEEDIVFQYGLAVMEEEMKLKKHRCSIPGRKAVLRGLMQQLNTAREKKMEMYAAYNAHQEEYNARREEVRKHHLVLHEKQVKLMAEQEESTIMLCNAAGLNEVQREWLRVKQLCILKRLMDEEEDRQCQLALHEKQAKLMAEQEERTVMLCNTAELNEVQREWLRIKQLRILKRLRDEEEGRHRQLALHEKQAKLMAEQEERTVMLCNTAELDEVQREWLRIKQLRILKRLRDEEEGRHRQLALHEKQAKLMAEQEERTVMLCNTAELDEVQWERLRVKQLHILKSLRVRVEEEDRQRQLALHEKQLKVMAEQEERTVMLCNTTGLNEVQREWLRAKQLRILKRLRDEESGGGDSN